MLRLADAQFVAVLTGNALDKRVFNDAVLGSVAPAYERLHAAGWSYYPGHPSDTMLVLQLQRELFQARRRFFHRFSRAGAVSASPLRYLFVDRPYFDRPFVTRVGLHGERARLARALQRATAYCQAAGRSPSGMTVLSAVMYYLAIDLGRPVHVGLRSGHGQAGEDARLRRAAREMVTMAGDPANTEWTDDAADLWLEPAMAGMETGAHEAVVWLDVFRHIPLAEEPFMETLQHARDTRHGQDPPVVVTIGGAEQNDGLQWFIARHRWTWGSSRKLFDPANGFDRELLHLNPPDRHVLLAGLADLGFDSESYVSAGLARGIGRDAPMAVLTTFELDPDAGVGREPGDHRVRVVAFFGMSAFLTRLIGTAVMPAIVRGARWVDSLTLQHGSAHRVLTVRSLLEAWQAGDDRYRQALAELMRRCDADDVFNTHPRWFRAWLKENIAPFEGVMEWAERLPEEWVRIQAAVRAAVPVDNAAAAKDVKG
ncbi:MAG: hypothetical protein IRY83_16020 [Chloroflexi bacterium]|nr:hypothetical protein [Chloroflexota bacterium]